MIYQRDVSFGEINSIFEDGQKKVEENQQKCLIFLQGSVIMLKRTLLERLYYAHFQVLFIQV